MTYTKNKQGSILVFTLIILFFILASALGLAGAALIARKDTMIGSKSTQSFQVADSGAEIVLQKLQQNPTKKLSDIFTSSWLDADTKLSGTTNGKSYYVYFCTSASCSGSGAVTTTNDAYVKEIKSIRSIGTYAGTTRSINVPVVYYQDRILSTSGLVSYWTMDSNWNDAVISSGNNGTASAGMTRSTTYPEIKFGKDTAGGAGKFNGTSDYVFVPDSPSMRTTSDWTRELWVQPTTTTPSAYQEVWTQRSGDPNKFLIRLNTNNTWNVYYRDSSGGFSPISFSAISPDIWQHIVVTKNGSNIVVYKNGVSVGSASNAGNFPDDSHEMYLGATILHTTNFFSGYIDEVAVYNRALTAAEVLAHYKGR